MPAKRCKKNAQFGLADKLGAEWRWYGKKISTKHECLDRCVGRIVDALENVGGEALITADHGNCEQMSDESTGQAHTAHTTEPVPFIYVGKRDFKVREGGVLAWRS